MELMLKLLIAIISLSGIAAGIALAYIAKEELKSGKKYFIFLRKGLYVLLSVAILYLFYQSGKAYLVPVYALFAVVLYLIDMRNPTKLGYCFHYLLFISSFFLLQEELLLSSLIFLYGFPVGTFLRN